MGRKIRFHQISMFEAEADEDRDRYMLEKALRYGHGHYQGYRVRVFAALTYPKFQEYAHLFLQRERENGGGTIPGSYDGMCSADATGFTVTCFETRPFTSKKYSWKACVKVIRQLIEEDRWLLKNEEFEVGRIVNMFDGLPYPRARLSYPECAWGVDTEQQSIAEALKGGG